MSDVLALITEDELDATALERFVITPANGALVTFRGIVRDHDHGESVTALDYEAHPDAQRFLDDACRIISLETHLRVAAAHRTGSLVVGDTALVACVAAPHRALAFDTASRLVDLIKQTVPIWKRQYLAGGVTEWVGL